MNWDDPAARARLIESVGIDRYNEMHAEHRKRSVVSTVNGWAIRPVQTARFGRIFWITDAARGYSTLAEAEQWCRDNQKDEP